MTHYKLTRSSGIIVYLTNRGGTIYYTDLSWWIIDKFFAILVEQSSLELQLEHFLIY
jgi:hypothetical protein